MRAVNEAIASKARFKLPSGYNIFWSGQYEYMLRAQQRLMIVVPLTLLIIILIIYLNTRSAIKTAIVMLAVPFSLWSALSGCSTCRLQSERRRLGRHHRARGLRRRNRRRHAPLPRPRLRAMAARRQNAQRRRPARRHLSRRGETRPPQSHDRCVIIAGLAPILWSHGAGADVMKRIATPMIGGVVTSTIMELVVYPAIFFLWRSRRMKKSESAVSSLESALV